MKPRKPREDWPPVGWVGLVQHKKIWRQGERMSVGEHGVFSGHRWTRWANECALVAPLPGETWPGEPDPVKVLRRCHEMLRRFRDTYQVNQAAVNAALADIRRLLED